MKTTRLLVVAAVISAAGSVFAGPTTEYVDYGSFVSTKTRAQVRAELEHARAQGSTTQTEYVTFDAPDIGARGVAGASHTARSAPGSAVIPEYVDFSHFVSTKTRSQVRAELEQANAHGAPAQREFQGR